VFPPSSKSADCTERQLGQFAPEPRDECRRAALHPCSGRGELGTDRGVRPWRPGDARCTRLGPLPVAARAS